MNMRSLSSKRAFTLFELLLVMGVIIVIATLAMPAFRSVQRSSALTRAEDELLGELSLARQHAIAVNRDVEVRFYRFKEASISGSPAQLRGIQSFAYSASGEAAPLRIMRTFPASTILDSGTTLSTIFASSRKKTWLGADTQPQLPGLGTDYEAWAFRFRPDGSTDLAPFPTTPWFITVHDRSAGDNLSTPPANYASVVVDPISGQTSSYRP